MSLLVVIMTTGLCLLLAYRLVMFKRKMKMNNNVKCNVNKNDNETEELINETKTRKYTSMFAGDISEQASIDHRKDEYKFLVDSFYDLVTDFYCFGWGESFHFSTRYDVTESFSASIARLEFFVALKLQVKSTDRLLDCGCGIGGPMRSIAKFAKPTQIDGITINQYQVTVGNQKNTDDVKKGLLSEAACHNTQMMTKCQVTQGDFMKMPWENETFDGVYAFESTCHAPDKAKCFEEIFRVLKPGGKFVGLEWLMLEAFSADDGTHRRVKEGIEIGNGLPTLETPEMLTKALLKAGFEIVEHYDMGTQPGQLSWFEPLKSQTFSLNRMSPIGRFVTHLMVNTLEFLKIAPKGSVKVSRLLNNTADDLVEAGMSGIFTPSYYFLVRKPLK